MTEIDANLAAGLAHRFRIVRRLGAGGMGAVFLAEQIAVGNRPVALKVLSRKLLDDPDFLLRFQNEAASTGRIHHPNVVTIYESGQADDGTPYIAMEFLEGESLRQALSRRGALPVPEVAEILQQAVRGLNAAHKLGIIHRDLKPDNIFLTQGDEDERIVKVVDFGIAKLRESGTHTQTGMVLGTPAYMSFEQASGMRSDELDARSDIYSLGVVTYEMLTGRPPFHSDTPVGYLRMHMQEEPPPFRVVKPDLPALPQLEGVVMKALTKDRKQRYSAVLEFAREFAQATTPDSRPAEKPQPQVTLVPVPERPHPSRRKWVVLASCFVFLLVAAAAGFRYWARSVLRPVEKQSESPLANPVESVSPGHEHPGSKVSGTMKPVSPAPEQTARGNGLQSPTATLSPFVLERTLTAHGSGVLSVASSPDGKLLAAAIDKAIELWNVESKTLRQTLTGHSDTAIPVAFSPDGKLLASGSKDKTIKLWDVASGTLKQTLRAHTSSVESVAFSPDGKLLASGSDDTTIKLWDVATGALQQTLSRDQLPEYSVAFSPDGKLLASGRPDKTIRLWDVATWTLKQTLTGHSDMVNSVAFSSDGKLLASGSEDKTIKLWDVAVGAVRQTLAGNSDGPYLVAFSPNGKLLASAVGKRIKLWNVESGTLRQTLVGPSRDIISMAYSSDGKLLASASGDKRIWIWRCSQ